MTIRFLKILKRSKKLKSLYNAISKESFLIPKTLNEIVSMKRIKNTFIISNIKTSLIQLNVVNIIIKKINSYKSIQASDDNNDHVLENLEKLWNNLKPGIKRSNNAINSSDWSEIGFQGNDPRTDFRGMGLLGLYNLLYLSDNYPIDARKILLESNHIRRYFPFAATGTISIDMQLALGLDSLLFVGINVTAYCLDLLNSTRLHKTLIYKLGNSPINESADTSIEAHLIDKGVQIFNEIYCKLYIDFLKLWVERDPPDIMSFHGIFHDFKSSMNDDKLLSY